MGPSGVRKLGPWGAGGEGDEAFRPEPDKTLPQGEGWGEGLYLVFYVCRRTALPNGRIPELLDGEWPLA